MYESIVNDDTPWVWFDIRTLHGPIVSDQIDLRSNLRKKCIQTGKPCKMKVYMLFGTRKIKKHMKS